MGQKYTYRALMAASTASMNVASAAKPWTTGTSPASLGRGGRDGNGKRRPQGDGADAQGDGAGHHRNTEPGQQVQASVDEAEPDHQPGEGGAGVAEYHRRRDPGPGGTLPPQAAARHPGAQHVNPDAGGDDPGNHRRD